MQKLTIKQKIVLDFIEWFISSNGYSPTIKEIQEELKFKYPNSVFKILTLLEEKKYISTVSGKSRTIKVLRGVEDEY